MIDSAAGGIRSLMEGSTDPIPLPDPAALLRQAGSIRPLARALRVDKLTLAGLGWTLRALLEGREREVPVLRMLLASAQELAERAERIAAGLRALGWSQARVSSGHSPVGGGSLPDVQLPSSIVQLALDERAAGELAAGLRRGHPPVLVRVQRGVVHLDPRTLEDADVEGVLRAFGDHADVESRS